MKTTGRDYILDGISWVLGTIATSFVRLYTALSRPSAWADWPDPEALVRFGASKELFFVVLTFFLVLTVIGIARRSFMWGMV